ncbi:NAD-dependent epimerase/dehydratase family protein [Acidimicrobiia bacterium]|nr:NAD-dependent epimerase/dehydratase family protein [Acidimicrobiia bacterium]
MYKLKVLIFGSRGLVGSSLCRVLSNNENINEIISATREDADLLNLTETKKLIQELKPDVVINAAAKVGGVLANNLLRSEFLIENIKININILESIIPFSEIKVINLGSSCIYPLNAQNPIKEESIMSGKLEPTNSPYAMAKLTAIELGDSISKQFGHQIINLMPTNLYGPNDNYSDKNSHVIPGLIQRFHKAKIDGLGSVEVWGSGDPKREFLYVDDLADCILYLLKNDIVDTLLNVGSGYEVSIKQLVSRIVELTNYKGEVVYNHSLPDGNPKKMIDSSKINNLGWSSSTSLDEGLRNTYSWYVNNIS